jgi:hypothetical protein
MYLKQRSLITLALPNVKTLQILEHLNTAYGKIKCIELEINYIAMTQPADITMPF